MTQVGFSNAYARALEGILHFENEYKNMSASQRANGEIDVQREMDKVFDTKNLDEMLGHHVDITV